MASKKNIGITSPPPLGDEVFRDLLDRPSVAREMFLPFGRARWMGPRYTLGRGERRSQMPTVSGVRIQEPDPNNVDIHREKGCQRDLITLVRSVVELRKTPQLSNLVLGDYRDGLVSDDAGEAHRKRVLFPLYCASGDLFQNENEAAAECHRQIVAAGKSAQHTLREEVPLYDPQTGFDGLLAWADRVKWKRRRRIPWWLLLLLLLPLLFLPCMCYQPQKSARFFETEIETDSLVIVVDKSNSMKPSFENIQREAKRSLTEFKKNKRNPYVDVIFFDKNAESVLGGIEELNDKNFEKIISRLDALQTGGGTNLRSGLELAGQEIGKHGKPTTILVLSDGEDRSLAPMKNEIDEHKRQSSVLKPLGGADAVFRHITPRFMEGAPKPRPPTNEEVQWEAELKALSDAYNANSGGKPSGAGGGGAGGGAGPGGGGAGPAAGGGGGGGGPAAGAGAGGGGPAAGAGGGGGPAAGGGGGAAAGGNGAGSGGKKVPVDDR